MLKVLDVFRIGDMLSVTLEGPCKEIGNGTALIDENGNVVIVKSVAMLRYTNPKDFDKSTTIMIEPCDIHTGSELKIA